MHSIVTQATTEDRPATIIGIRAAPNISFNAGDGSGEMLATFIHFGIKWTKNLVAKYSLRLH